MRDLSIIGRYRELLGEMLDAWDETERSRKDINTHMTNHDERGELQDQLEDPCLGPLLQADDGATLRFDNAVSTAKAFLGRD